MLNEKEKRINELKKENERLQDLLREAQRALPGKISIGAGGGRQSSP